MGGGSGNTNPQTISGISGQGGGRVMPGTACGVGEVFSRTDRPTYDAVTAYPDLRPSKPRGSPFDTWFGSPGGGPGQAGASDTFVVYGDFNQNVIKPTAGGGGGWGAAGGAGRVETGLFEDPTFITSGNPGAAGGKAINTNGHAVTWLGGATRAYGAVG